MSFGFDMVDSLSRTRPAIAQALLTDVTVTLKDVRPDDVPLTAIAALVAAKPPLMLLPAFIAVCFTVT